KGERSVTILLTGSWQAGLPDTPRRR
ncbi:unnamed protein product, partial [Linum tenue]